MKINDFFIDRYLNLNVIVENKNTKKPFFFPDIALFDWRTFDRISTKEIKPFLLRIEEILSKKTSQAEKIFKLINLLLNFENIMYSNFPYYRDHFFHLIRVAGLGEFLLDVNFKDTNYQNYLKEIKDLVENQFNCEKNTRDIKKCWYITAFLHDFSLPLNMFNTLFCDILKVYNYDFFSILFNIKQNSEIDTFLDNPKNFCRKLISLLINSIFNKINYLLLEKNIPFIKLYEEIKVEINTNLENFYKILPGNRIILDHGLLSAYFFIVEFSGNDKLKYDEIVIITISILIHNMKNITVNFDEHPLAYFLVLIDEMQEWSRPLNKYYKNSGCERSIYDTIVIPILNYIDLNLEKVEISPSEKSIYRINSNNLEIGLNFENTIDLLNETGFDMNFFISSKKPTIKRLIKSPKIPNLIWFVTMDYDISQNLSERYKSELKTENNSYKLIL